MALRQIRVNGRKVWQARVAFQGERRSTINEGGVDVIERSDIALLAAIWRELEEHEGDEADAAWAVWERIKEDSALRQTLLVHIREAVADAPELRDRAEEALRVTEGDYAAAQQALQELIDPRENPETAERVEADVQILNNVFVEIMHRATEAWRRERRGGE
jgi:hypothetical protein